MENETNIIAFLAKTMRMVKVGVSMAKVKTLQKDLDALEKEQRVLIEEYRDDKIAFGMDYVFGCEACPKRFLCNAKNNPYRTGVVSDKCIMLDDDLDWPRAFTMIAYVLGWSGKLITHIPRSMDHELEHLKEHLASARDIIEKVLASKEYKKEHQDEIKP
jgi:hypothetical protein